MGKNINFIKEEVVSVSEKNKNKKLEFASLAFFLVALLIVTAVLAVNIFVTSSYNNAKKAEENLIASLSQPDNKKKETLFFLIKDRMIKLGVLDKTRILESKYFNNLLKINDALKIDTFKMAGKGVETVAKVDSYDKFDSFLKNLENYDVNRDTLVVSQTHLQNGVYEITFKFAFK